MRTVNQAGIIDGQLVRFRVDSVGNNLTATLHWCLTHVEPVWVYGDGSYACPYDHIVGWSPDEHLIVPWPFEMTPFYKGVDE